MNAPAIETAVEIPTVPGTPFQGGFYVGQYRIGTEHFALIVSPKEFGEHEPAVWADEYKTVAGTDSVCDGLSNTIAMMVAELPLATWARNLSINGFNDWFLPSRDELELCYRYLKPTEDENYTWRHGENPSALPVATYAYTEQSPQQTTVDAFKESGAEAFEDTWYWTSSQSSAYYAWCQYFDDGFQFYDGKGSKGRARAVRRFLII